MQTTRSNRSLHRPDPPQASGWELTKKRDFQRAGARGSPGFCYGGVILEIFVP